MKRTLATIHLGLLLFGCAPAISAVGAGYVFTNIADTTTAAPVGTFSGLYNPSISNGVVAFGAQYSGGTLEGIFTGTGGPIATIAKEGDAAPTSVFTDLGSPSISDGRVTFYGRFDNGKEGIFVDRNGLRTTIAKTGDVGPSGAFTFLNDPVSSGDNVAFTASATGGAGIYISKSGVLSAIAKIGDLGPTGTPFNGLVRPAISGDKVAFHGTYSSPSGDGVFVGNGGSLTTIVKTGDPAPVGTFPGADYPSISDSTIAFFSGFEVSPGEFRQGVFTGGAGPVSTVALKGGPAPIGTYDSVANPAIGGGAIAFLGSYNGESALLLSKSGNTSVVLKGGEPLFGSTVFNFGIDPGPDVVDADGGGRIAFFYVLSDGRFGIALATPVPEPSAITLFALGWTFASFLPRRRR